MKKIGKYCKAYHITKFRDFQGWREKPDGFWQDETTISSEGQRSDAIGDKFLYLQEDFTVTDGILLGEHVIFDSVTLEWVEYCKNTLQFQIPE